MDEQIKIALLRCKKKRIKKNELDALFANDSDYLQALNKMLDEGSLFFDDNWYYLVNYSDYVRGKLSIKVPEYGFLLSEDGRGDCYINASNFNGAFANDICIAKASSSGYNRRDGVIVKIIKRGIAYVVGNVVEKKKLMYVVSDNQKDSFNVLIPKNFLHGAMPNHKVRADIREYVDSNLVIAEVVNILGHRNDPGIDILSVVCRYNIPTGFSNELLDEVSKIPDTVLKSELADRVDLRDQNIITIDGDDTKDIDDAVVLWKLSNGNYHLGVHIADVSHYVKKKTLVDDEAYLRGTSVYLVDRVIPMLPHRLSNGICSLNPNEDRLAVSCEMEIDASGSVVKSKVFPSIIRSREQMTYQNVNKILDGEPDLLVRYEPYVAMFREMNELRKVLSRKRYLRGSLDFLTTEAKILCDENGTAIDVKAIERGKSEQIIEEFMIVANETIAKKMSKYSFIYRIHEKPDTEKLDKVMDVVKNLGQGLKDRPLNTNPKTIQSFLNKIQGTQPEKAINILLLRSMMKAKYSEVNVGHYGLGSEYYTHFTSPIRRYPDLIVHRLIRDMLFEKNINSEHQQHILKQIAVDAMHTSYREREATDCERECDDMKKAEYMEKYIGNVYSGMIIGIMAFGFFVQLPNTVEGLVSIHSLNDYYEFDEERMILIGEKTRHIFRIGDIIDVKVVSANKYAEEINFELIDNPEVKRGRHK